MPTLGYLSAQEPEDMSDMVKENVPRNWQDISQVLLSGSTASLICTCQLVVGVLLDLAFLAMGFSGMGWCPALPVRSWYLAGKF